MEDFDIFTNEIHFTKPVYKNILNKFVYDAPPTPNGPNYQSGRKLLADESFADNDEAQCAFHLSEAVSPSIRTMAIYREEQHQMSENNLYKITSFLKPIQELIDLHPISKTEENFLDLLLNGSDDVTEALNKFNIDDELPFHKKYLRFSKENNVDNFHRILKELPKEWTVIQLTAPYNPNENLKPFTEYRTEIDSIYVSVFTNDYLDICDVGPFTVNVPANVTKEGEKPLFTELYSILDENYKTIDNAQFLNNKRLVQNYWNRREDIDLRMKSVINVMDKQWLGGWGCLLSGRLLDSTLRDKVGRVVDATIADWGFIRLTKKQKVLLCNLIESSPAIALQQVRSCVRRILTEQGDPADVRRVLEPCGDCTKDFKYLNEICLKCLSKCFELVHHFSLVDGIKAFSQLATQVKDGDEWSALKKAKRHPVILIVDEMLDTFPWETLPVLIHHPVSRIENVHFLYYLYKLHEKDIVGGYFNTRGHEGRYVINPEKNLDRMEKRMSSFVEYWCGGWKGHVSQAPPPEDFIDYLTNSDIFLYCGHGDGCHFGNGGARGVGVEGAACRALVVLSGCGSVRLARAPGATRAPPAAAHRRLHVAGSPLVVGMLWEVTDLEVDKVVSALLALCVPPARPPAAPAPALPWPAVGKQAWSQGELDLTQEAKVPFLSEPEVLRAAARARAATKYVMIASSVVARGLPLRIR